ncbi:ras-related and estrogen-regulated growth inhibitor-like isoform X1 [Haliotis rubra]|uniref:ras-related and estrogen-regulated growth inhibitor-like isoform X1 n=2 Tax=Haliotis rubra TaxID=36100 RepID=UPI001EE52AB7|nr:ras-related and estrogen-regulated growth inhibitor-like isoform X1 [Haliotis rubra]
MAVTPCVTFPAKKEHDSLKVSSGYLNVLRRHSVEEKRNKMNGTRLKPPNGDSKDGHCRLVILGTPGVGKTALTVRYLTRRFIGEYCPTLESVYKYHTRIDEDDVKLEILDTAGQIRAEWKDGYALWADSFIFVYSITDRNSFNEITRIKKSVENARKSSTLAGILVGNKNDLLHDRQVSEIEGQELADELGCRFYEVSAADWTQVEVIQDVFRDMYREFKRSRSLKDGRQRKTSSSQRFKQAIQKVITGKSNNNKRTATM